MIRTPLLLCLALSLASCKTITTERVDYPGVPVSFHLVSDMVDEETLEHSVKFRNTGSSIISFDYTIADDPSVPHTDGEGPNSGVVENLYPGAEIAVKNPLKTMKNIHVVLGKVVYGRKSSDEITRLFKPQAAKAAQAMQSSSGPTGGLPLLEPVNAADLPKP